MSGAGERELRIGEVARRAGTTPRTIRYYEELGLLPTASGREPGVAGCCGSPVVDLS